MHSRAGSRFQPIKIWPTAGAGICSSRWIMLICGLAWLISSAIKGQPARHDLAAERHPETLADAGVLSEAAQRAAAARHLQSVAEGRLLRSCSSCSRRCIVLTGLALSPGIDAIAHPLTWVFGGRQFARLWHFVAMWLLIGVLRGAHVPSAYAGRPQSNERDDHRLVSLGQTRRSWTVKRRLFVATTISSALAACAPIGTALNNNAGFHKLLGSTQGLTHAAIGHARARQGISRARYQPGLSASTVYRRRRMRTIRSLRETAFATTN